MEPNRPKDEGFALIGCYPYCFGTDYPDTSPSLLPMPCFFPKTNLDCFPCFLFISISGCGGGDDRLVAIVTAVPSHST